MHISIYSISFIYIPFFWENVIHSYVAQPYIYIPMSGKYADHFTLSRDVDMQFAIFYD